MEISAELRPKIEQHLAAMKNLLHLFRSRSEPELPPHLAPFPPLQPRGPALNAVVASMMVLFASFAGLAAGLKWLQSDAPRDNRPWEPHETLMAATPTSVSDEEMLEAPNPDSLPPLDSPFPADTPAPPATRTPPATDQPTPAIAERLADKPQRGPEPVKKSASSKTAKSSRVKTSSSKVASTTKAAPSSKKRTVAQAAKSLGNRSLEDTREKKSPEFAQSDLDTAEQQFPEDEAPYYSDRGNSFPQRRVLRPFFEENGRDYYDRPPRREFARTESPQFMEVRRPNVVVRYRVNYGVSSSRDRILVRRVFPSYRVIAVREREDW